MGAMCALIRPAFRVLVDLEQTKSVPQNELRGILDFARESSRWSTWIPGRGVGGATSPDPERMGADGVIAGWRTDAALLRRAFRRGIPVVSFAAPRRSRAFAATVSCDNASIARLAAEHFLAHGFRDFAFVGDESHREWSEPRLRAFRRLLAARGLRCAAWAGAAEGFGAWLAALPRPCAVFAACDAMARRTLDAARDAGLSVPDDLAVLGVDDDVMLCETSDPPLSSVALDAARAGREAAAALDAAMRGRREPTRRIAFGGVRVAARASTERFAAKDRLVARALALIAAGADARIGVAELARELGVSRRTLETRFRAGTGTPPGAAMLRARLDRARGLLRATDLTQEAVADACGFCDAGHMSRLFRRRFGAPPSAFRGR